VMANRDNRKATKSFQNVVNGWKINPLLVAERDDRHLERVIPPRASHGGLNPRVINGKVPLDRG